MTRFFFLIIAWLMGAAALPAQINTTQVIRIGRNTLYFEDYVLSIQYFNQAIQAKPYLAEPYLYRAIAKLNLEDFDGAEADASLAIERNPFITDAYEVRGVARQNLGRTSQAVNDYDLALKNMPGNKNLLFNKALAQTDLKDYAGAHSTFSELLEAYPGYDGGYMGRARLFLLQADTIHALSDAEKALEINKNSVGARLMRADIRISRNKDYKGALEDIDFAIKNRPLQAELYVNRAYARYMLDDFNGAANDFDYALQLDPANLQALFNRGLLRSEVHDLNRAIDDFTQVLQFNPEDYKALYNRAMLYSQIGDFKNAIADLNQVINRFPDFAAAHFLLYDVKRQAGDMAGAQKAYNRSMALAGKKVENFPETPGQENSELTQQQVKTLFTALQTAPSDQPLEQSFNNPDIKGRVQDKNTGVDMMPMVAITYYTSPTELKPSGDFLSEIQELNKTGLLRFLLQVSTNEPILKTEDDYNAHFESIEQYNSYLATHPGRAIDFVGRAMDYMTVRDYDNAIKDLGSALNLTPDLSVAHFIRAMAIYKKSHDTKDPIELQRAINDLDSALNISPRMAAAYYNRGFLEVKQGNIDRAIDDFSKAIDLKSDFGEAYFNRGYAFLSQGRKDKALQDLSRAGSLGIVPAYNLMKKIRR